MTVATDNYVALLKEIVRGGGARATNGQKNGPNGPLVAMLWCVKVDAKALTYQFFVAEPCFFPMHHKIYLEIRYQRLQYCSSTNINGGIIPAKMKEP